MQSYLIIDIETSPVAWEYFDEAQHEYLLRGANSEEEEQRKKNEMALSPMTAHVICIGMVQMVKNDDDSYREEKRVCLMRSVDDSDERHKETLASGTVLVRYAERTMMSDFWKFLKQHNEQYRKTQYITFNGRGFDFPFLMLRSAVLGIRPSVNLMSGTRWSYRDHHTDLLDELTYQMPQQSGATRRFNFDFFAKSFGIASPKAEGVDGSKVAEFYAAADYATIAEYCMRDVLATWELYKKWAELLKF